MTEATPTATDTAECPRDHVGDGYHRPNVCWLCGRGQRPLGVTPIRPVPAELAAAYRIGGEPAVHDLVRAHPEDYPRLAKSYQIPAPIPADDEMPA